MKIENPIFLRILKIYYTHDDFGLAGKM